MGKTLEELRVRMATRPYLIEEYKLLHMNHFPIHTESTLITDVDFKKRLVSGYAVLYDVPVNDLSNNWLLLPGMFKNRIGDNVRTRYDHGLEIGKPVEIRDDKKGLFNISFIGRSTLASDVLLLIEDGILSGWSIGFNRLSTWKKYLLFGPSLITKGELTEISICSNPTCRQANKIEYGEKVFKAIRDGKYQHESTWAMLEAEVKAMTWQEDEATKKRIADMQKNIEVGMEILKNNKSETK